MNGCCVHLSPYVANPVVQVNLRIDILSKYAKMWAMNINDWQEKQQISDAELAKKMGISISYLSRIKRGLRRLSPEKAEHTEAITGGAVSAMELLFPDKAN